MNVFAFWAVALASAMAALGLGVLWRRAVAHNRTRERLWRYALQSLAERDYKGARTLAATMAGAIPDTTQPSAAYSGTMPSGVLLSGTVSAVSSGERLADALRGAADAMQASEREQERERRELEDVLASLQDAVLVVDGESRLRFLNASALGLFAVRVEDVLGASLLEALPSFGLEAAVREALQDGRSTMREVSLYGAQVREVFLRVAPVRRSRGEVSGAVAILQDLTELRRLERVRRDFVANASHELRTPIANIRAGAETILSDPGDTQMAARFLPNLVTEAERLSHLVTDLLDLARAESTADTPRAPVDMAAIATSVVQRLSDKAAKNNVTLLRDYGNASIIGVAMSSNGDSANGDSAIRDSAIRETTEGEETVETVGMDDAAGPDAADSVRVVGDAAALEQVVFNLLDNALMYTPAGGAVTLRLHPAAADKATAGHDVGNAAASSSAAVANAALIGGVPHDASHAPHTTSQNDFSPDDAARKSVMLSVSDTGIGIPAADLERVFERFYRVDKARSRTQGGTGLGLAIVKHIVENHGGHVTVQSEAGQGSTFTVTLPAM